ncbi:MAG: TetR/AcrR family transcriptional regulator [Clostridiales bacterium]|nr:TetR/AcrR family transcriptional regulator [Clostridiales bacterium]
MRKQPEVTDATREAFIDAFFQLAKGKSINRITIREITSLAGYSRTTFYRYFEDVYALMEYAEDGILQGVNNALKACGAEQFPSDSKFFEVVTNCFQQNKERVAILVSEQNRSHFLRKIKENITNHMNQEHDATPKKRIIMDIYFYGIFHAISSNLQSKDALSDEDLLDVIKTMFNNWYLPEMTQEA